MVLVIEDDKNIRELVCHIVEAAGYPCEATDSVENGIHKLKELMPTLLLVDMLLIDGYATPLIKWCQEKLPKTKIVLMSGMVFSEIEKVIQDLGLEHFMKKPFSLDELEKTLA